MVMLISMHRIKHAFPAVGSAEEEALSDAEGEALVIRELRGRWG